jgi:hypothetical protein
VRRIVTVARDQRRLPLNEMAVDSIAVELNLVKSDTSVWRTVPPSTSCGAMKRRKRAALAPTNVRAI